MAEVVDSITATYEELDLDACPNCGGDHSVQVTMTFDPTLGQSVATWKCMVTAHG